MTEVVDDTRKGTTYGDPDGPERFVETLDVSVPTYIDERLDLIPDVHGRQKAFKRIDYHVPYQMRGDFKLGQWPQNIQMKYGATTRTDMEGYVLCAGVNKGSRSGQRSSEPGSLCKKRARNRTLFCEIHGGGLHPADKKMTSMSVQTIPQDRVERLNRVQKFMQGFITPEELSDEEIQGAFVLNEEGVKVHGYKLGAKFQALMAKEMHRRLNDFLKSNTSDMLKVMVDIARNDMYEAADRIVAAKWVAEKTMGKAPDVLVTSTTNQPYVSILDSIEGGSREAYRETVNSTRGGVGAPYEIIDAEIEPDDDEPENIPDYEGTTEDCEAVGSVEDCEAVGEVEVQDSEDSEQSTVVHVNRVVDAREEKLAKIKALKKAKQRRYAARAVGATSLTAVPWLVEFVPYERDERSRRRVCDERDAEGYMLKFYPPDTQTPAVLDRLRAAYERNDHGESNGQSEQ